MAEQYSNIYLSVYLYHIFFIYSAVDGHLGWFYNLTTVNNAAMNIGMHVSFPASVFGFFRMYTQEWNCWVIWQFYVQFSENPPYCFPQWLHQLHSHQKSTGFSLSPHSCLHLLVVIFFFGDGHSDRCEVISHYGFDLCFSDYQ